METALKSWKAKPDNQTIMCIGDMLGLSNSGESTARYM